MRFGIFSLTLLVGCTHTRLANTPPTAPHEEYIHEYATHGPIRGNVAKTLLGSSALDLRGRATTLAPGATGADLTLSGNEIVAGNLTVQGGNSIILTTTTPQVYGSAATGTYYVGSNISAANAGATPATSMLSIYPQQALDATDWVLNVANSANASSLFNVAYNGAINIVGTATTSNITMNGSTTLNVGGGSIVTAGAATQWRNGANLWNVNTAPTVSGFCTSPAVSASNGSIAFDINVGTACAASTGTITFTAATTAWVCTCHDVTTPASNYMEQTGGTTSTCTMQNYVRTTGVAGNFTSSDHYRCEAFAY